MDESQIEADLKAKLPKPDIPENGWDGVKPPEKTDQSFLESLPIENSLEKMKLFDYFELSPLDRKAPQASKYLTAVVQWAQKEAGSDDYYEILKVVNEQERVMGNLLKQGRLSNLYKFATIRNQRRQLDIQERVLYG